MPRAVPVFRVEADLHPNAIADLRAGRPTDVAVQVQIKTPVPDWHHIDAPRLRGLAVNAHENRKRLAPAGFEGFCLEGVTRMCGLMASRIFMTEVKRRTAISILWLLGHKVD